jgi:surfactin synthase thioesterase subunit
MPVQVFQGRGDAAVDPHMVETWSRRRPYVELHMLDDDHQLHASLEHMWKEMERFLFGRSSYQQIP